MDELIDAIKILQLAASNVHNLTHSRYGFGSEVFNRARIIDELADDLADYVGDAEFDKFQKKD